MSGHVSNLVATNLGMIVDVNFEIFALDRGKHIEQDTLGVMTLVLIVTLQNASSAFADLDNVLAVWVGFYTDEINNWD